MGRENQIFLAAGYTLRLAREISYFQVAAVAATFLICGNFQKLLAVVNLKL
jgi:hypothetical protein